MSDTIATEEEIRLHNECDRLWLEYIMNPTKENRDAFDMVEDEYIACYKKRCWNTIKDTIYA